MARSTRATKALEAARVAFTIHEYDYDPQADRVGLQAAAALDEVPARVLKTLMVLADGKPACAILASDREVAMKKLAAALGAKGAAMMPPADAERISGYKVGGISPFGQARVTRFVLDAAAAGHERVFLNGGQRGLQVRLDPRDIVAVLRARVADIAAGAG